ncbi:hypothetical protein GUJ93_ZPchr0008g12379 [Zizania palustris]|uniref:Uncharacterized protein n=1 Tax=Zizania palustris TaxID=103762 RepID=A0A8J5VIM3_ZIZPA|nr:hypothetical protein GUJ93_ZPchr0008g12379 [Zizania palustris]
MAALRSEQEQPRSIGFSAQHSINQLTSLSLEPSPFPNLHFLPTPTVPVQHSPPPPPRTARSVPPDTPPRRPPPSGFRRRPPPFCRSAVRIRPLPNSAAPCHARTPATPPPAAPLRSRPLPLAPSVAGRSCFAVNLHRRFSRNGDPSTRQGG